MSKTRLDVAMAAQGLAESRQKAQAIIMSGLVFVDGKRVNKCGAQIADTAVIEVRGKTLRYVSRGGLKLEKAMQCFPLTLQDAVAMDCGASTGGFTDCMLKHGAKVVYAVDVGQTQLNENLLKNKKVVVKDFLNARDITISDVNGKKDFLTIDVSFISLKLVLPACFNLLKDDGQAVVLVKPQFEVGKKLGKSGIVVNPVDRMKVVNDILNFARELGFSAEGITTVPDNFKNKNVEYLLYFKKTAFVSRPVKSVDLSLIKNL